MAVDSPLTLSRLVANVLGHLALALFLSVILAGCGGGGGGGGSAAPSSGTSGSIVKGPVANSTVRLYSLDSNGVKTLLATTTTNAAGSYQFNATPAAGTILIVEASGGNYVDEVTRQAATLSGDFRAVGVANGAAVRMSVSPFSEAVVAEIAATTPGNWSAARVQAANAAMSDWLGVTDLLDFRPVELHGPSAEANAAAASDDDWFMALQLGGFSGFLQRAGSPMSLPQGIGVLRTILQDPDDDRYATSYLLGILDFIDSTGFAPNDKRTFKGLLLLDSPHASDAEIAAALPTGQATGSASAPMQDDAFEFVPDLNMARQSPIRTHFNGRGALVAYQHNTNDPDFYRVINTASVGEVYGDGEVGIGRWHGGFASDVIVGSNSRTVHRQYLPAGEGYPYAVAIPASNMPACGIRVLQLAAATHPIQLAATSNKPFIGFSQNSRVAVQYVAGTAYVGLDLELQFSGGVTYRVVSQGGLTAPWASGVAVGADKSFEYSSPDYSLADPSSPLSRLEANAILAGSGARKIAAMVRIRPRSADAETIAVVLSAPDTGPGPGGCTTSSEGDGTTISPPPQDGTYYVFAGAALSHSTFMGVPKPAAFGANGALRKAGFDLNAPELNIPPDTPVFGLAGNSKASIGRIRGSFILSGNAYDVSLPYAVAAAHADGTYPRTGTRSYRLLNATAPIVVINNNGTPAELAPGQIVGAALELNFGESPVGTPNFSYGTASLQIAGTAGGTAFNMAFPFGTTTYYKDSGTFSAPGSFDGVLAGDDFEFAVVTYRYGAGSGIVHGVLLFEEQ